MTEQMMRELPVDAKVVCTDGDAGRLSDIIVDPVARKVTHIVVESSNHESREFLVPVDRVTSSSQKEVHLSCTRDEVAEFTEFTTVHFVSASSPEAQPVLAAQELAMWSTSYGYEPIYMPYMAQSGEDVPIVEAQVPAGEVAIERGMHLLSTDGEELGDVTAFVIGPEDGQITHFVLRMGSMTHANEVTLPISLVQRTDAGPRVSLTKEQLERLPSVPAGGKYRAAGGDDGSARLLSVVFDAPERADEALQLVRAEAKQDHLGHIEAAVVRKSEDGKLHVDRDNHISTGKGAGAGAVVGGLLSVLGGPIGVVAGAGIGAAAGGLVGHARDHGVPDRYVRDLGRALRGSSSAIVLLVDQEFETPLLQTLEPLHGQVLRLAISDEMLERLTASA